MHLFTVVYGSDHVAPSLLDIDALAEDLVLDVEQLGLFGRRVGLDAEAGSRHVSHDRPERVLVCLSLLGRVRLVFNRLGVALARDFESVATEHGRAEDDCG